MGSAWKNIIFYHKAGSETISFTTSPQNAWDRNFDTRGAQAGLYPDHLVQGAQGTGRDYPAHPHRGGDYQLAVLSFLGFGLSIKVRSWGGMLSFKGVSHLIYLKSGLTD